VESEVIDDVEVTCEGDDLSLLQGVEERIDKPDLDGLTGLQGNALVIDN
jgi:hypothetical protein